MSIASGESAVAELAVCGWDEVFILRLEGPTDSIGRVVWSWNAADEQDLPDTMKTRFGSTDDCKPVDGGRAILVTSSGDGVALVERATKKVLFWASAVNAHSADLLPGGLVAVAASHDPDRPGDRLVLFAPGTPGREIAHYELPSGHGVVWDSRRELLYALGYDLVRVFRLSGGLTGEGALEEVSRIELPATGGHELYPVPGTPYLSVSTSRQCWLLDRDTETVVPHPVLADHAGVKSIGVNPRSGQLAWTEAEGSHWWATRIRMLDPPNLVRMPDRRLYKVRWLEQE
ncbi:MAG: hypothetical protein FVQ81_02740 [Candidatus Glassbacteria bacterium]|nr:hypothetical protein [Candidatus Glassbacteria bacterium]